MTEHEAKTKRCPIAFPITLFGVIAQPSDIADAFIKASKCGGSECMMWRWDYVITNSQENKDHVIGKCHGYCGLNKP